jgi:hypothetical protein
MRVVIYGVLCVLVIALTVATLILGLARGDLIWARDEALKERDEAKAERDDAVHEISRLLTNQACQDDTVRLPRWQDFLPQRPALPADTIADTLEALERHANGEGR